MDRRSNNPALLLASGLAALAALALTGCERPGCEYADRCVEQCFTPAFLQCDGCPAGSFEEELCDRPRTCAPREVGRPPGTCTTPCTEGPSGRCTTTADGDLCTYDECERDADCAEGLLCACNGGHLMAHVCVPAACERPEDCGDYPCSAVTGCGGPTDPTTGAALALACHSAADECLDDRSCPEGQFCTLAVEDPTTERGTWRCTEPFCD